MVDPVAMPIEDVPSPGFEGPERVPVWTSERYRSLLASYLEAVQTSNEDVHRAYADQWQADMDADDWHVPTTLFDRPNREATDEPWAPMGYRLLTEDERSVIDQSWEHPFPRLAIPPRAVIFLGNLWHKATVNLSSDYYPAVPKEVPLILSS